MPIPVKLPVFEGPLDLLLHLIDKNKIDIYDIPIALITDQYMAYVQAMDRENLDVVSEFMVMAATLIDIKCRMLLPKETDEAGEEEDPREELVRQLLEYKMYKYMSDELRERMAQAEKTFYRKPSLPEAVRKYRPKADPEALLSGVTLDALHRIFEDVLRRREDKVDPIRSKFGRIEKEAVSLPERITDVKCYADTHGAFTFRALLGRDHGKLQMIITFLAVLELIRSGEIQVRQEETFGEITIESTADTQADSA